MTPPPNVPFEPDAVDRENVLSRCSRISFGGTGQSFSDKTHGFESSFFPHLGERLWLTGFLHGLLTRQDDQLLTFGLLSGPGPGSGVLSFCAQASGTVIVEALPCT